MLPSLHLLIKPASGACNLRCQYCFYHDLSEKREQASYGMMDAETQEAVIQKALSYAGRSCTLAYQGGEPTLAGLAFYQKAVELEEKYNTRHIAIHHAIQTNGYHLSEDWARFFAAQRYLVGLSLDGTAADHDAMRRTADGGKTFHEIEKTARLFDRHGVMYNILTVVNARTVLHPAEIYRYYVGKGYRYLQFIPCLDPLGDMPGSQEYSLTASDYGRFLCVLFDCWYQDLRKGRGVSIRQFDNYVQMRMGYPPESCGMSGVCGMQHVVEADGSVYPCDFYVTDAYRLGNLRQQSFAELQMRRRELRFLEDSLQRDPSCVDCPHYALCRGGCRRYREPMVDGWLSRNFLCEAYREFFSYAGKRIDQLAARFCRPL